MKLSRATLLLILMVSHFTITGAGYVINKLALMEFEATAYAFWRFLIGIGGLGLLAVMRGESLFVQRRDFPKLLLLALVAVPINQLVYLVGISKTMPSHASLLYGTTAVFALFLSAALGYEKIRGHKILAIIVALSGLALVVTKAGHVDTSSDLFVGDLLIFAAVLAWAAYTVLGKPLVAKYGSMKITISALLMGSFLSLPFLIIPALNQDYARVGVMGWSGVFYAGIMLTVVAYNIWYAILQRVDPSQTAILTTPQPVIATALSTVFVGEVIGWPLVAGGVLVIAGVVLMDAPAFRRRAGEFRDRFNRVPMKDS